MTNTPHDAVFKTVFEHPEHASGLFRSVLPAAIREAIDWSTMALESGSFIDADLAQSQSDLLFSVTLGTKPAFLYLLLEHQSTNDPDMPLRILFYMARIWRRHRKQHTGPLPAIIPVLVSHAPDGWSAPRSFHELIAPYPETIPGLAQLVPSFTLVVEDLAHLSNEELRSRALAEFPKLALWLLRDVRDKHRLYANLHAWARSVTEALRAPRGIEAVIILLRYITLANEQLTWQEFLEKIREAVPGAEEATMTIAEQLRAEGRAEGQVRGRADMLSKQLSLKFGELSLDHQTWLTNASQADLDLWAERVLFAATLDDVFVGSSR